MDNVGAKRKLFPEKVSIKNERKVWNGTKKNGNKEMQHERKGEMSQKKLNGVWLVGRLSSIPRYS